MKITKLSIPDIEVNTSSLDEVKIRLANKIILSMVPIIKPEVIEKVKQIRKIQNRIKSGRKEIVNEKSNLKELQNIYRKKNKVGLLLSRIDQLVNLGMDKTLKSEMINVVRKINTLSDDKIDFYLAEILRMITRRFSKIERE